MEQATFPAIKEAIDGTVAAFDEFKKVNDERTAMLLDRIEQIEAKASIGGLAGTKPNANAPASEAPNFVDIETGKPLCVLGKGIDTRAAMLAAGLLKDTDEPVTLSDFIRAVAGQKSSALATKALSEGTDSAGGYTVPNMILPQFIGALVPQSSLLAAGAQIVVLDAPGKVYNIARIDTLPTAAWRAESGSVSESDPVFGTVTLTPRSLSFFFKCSRELLADSTNIDAILMAAITSAFAKALDAAGLMGSGTPPTPRGLANVSGVQSVTNGANGTALGTIKWANFISAWSAIRAADAAAPTSAIMAPRTLTGLAALVDTTGQPLRRPELLTGITFRDTSAIPITQTVGTSTDCSTLFVADFTRCMFGMREQVSVMRADQAFATNGQVAFVCHLRADFAVEFAAGFGVVTGIRP